ncbi:HK97-gp10 family putative phage morphogenesis protein [Streptomyces microflavus]|uniref:HK97-gp10 family putative phage morphogenesis protein n=1 Tax=Streptomyces TaxID=1883 RepID=UPI000516A17A|nr:MULTISPECIES: HK97-gp10 family putative phage morphogenesis protein [Streptomyces]MDX2981207.1 HK97 gp10 family phage protein [Streptomyces sp. NRRL_B-2249]
MSRSGMTVEILGASRLRGRLEDLSDEIVQALQKAVKESAEAVASDTRRDVAKNMGNLERKVDIKYTGEQDLNATVGWHDPEDYYARFLEVGTRRAPAQPALGPALEAERARYRGRLTEAVRRALR